jgi:hypothetical protein
VRVACAVRWWMEVIVAVRMGCGMACRSGGESSFCAGVMVFGTVAKSEEAPVSVGGGGEVVDGVRSLSVSSEALGKSEYVAWGELEKSRMLSDVDCDVRGMVLVAGRVRTRRELEGDGF